MTPSDEPEAKPLATDPLAGIKALLDEREACEVRVKQINVELQKARGLIDARTLGVPRKPRIASSNGNGGAGSTGTVPFTMADDDTTLPPAAA